MVASNIFLHVQTYLGKILKIDKHFLFRWVGFETTTAQTSPEATDLHSTALVWKVLKSTAMSDAAEDWSVLVSQCFWVKNKCKRENNSSIE